MQGVCAVLLSVDCPALQYFSTLSNIGHDFREKKILEIIFFKVFYDFSETFLIPKGTERDMIKMLISFQGNDPFFLAQF